MATKTIATATVRAMKGRRLIPTRAALTLVIYHVINLVAK